MGDKMKETISKGQPKKKVSDILKQDKLQKFIQRVYQGQSMSMLCWEFKISPFDVKQLCKDNNLILNTGDIIKFCNRLHGRGVVD